MLEQLTPRVFYLPFSKTEGSPSLGYIRGDRFSLMVDAGTCPAHVGEYQNAVAAAGFRPPDFVALTHSHWDHCFGLGALAIPSIACTQTRQSLELVSTLSWTPEGIQESIRRGILPRSCAPVHGTPPLCLCRRNTWCFWAMRSIRSCGTRSGRSIRTSCGH